MARSRRSDPDSATVLVLAALVVASWLAEQPRWAQILMTVSAVVTALGWWSLFRMPTSCRVANLSNPRACSNPVKGMLTACWRPEHKARKRKLIWARLRGRPAPGTPRPAAPGPPARWEQSARSMPAGTDVDGYRVEGAAYQATMLVFTILGGLGGAAGVVSTVHALTSGSG